MSQAAAALATVPVIRALLDEARRKNFRSGVLGVRARPEWPGTPAFFHDDVPVQVVPCVSALAVREALLDRTAGEWLVLLTDRDEEDLGAGVLSHLVWHRLRTPDPWEAVRHRFAATGIDPVLTGGTTQRELAAGLLAATPPGGWPPAPGGILTRDHAFASVARRHLGLDDPDIDGTTVMTWTADTASIGRSGDLRQLAGDALTDEVLAWAARRVGPAATPLLRLLRDGRGCDALPLGLVAGVLVDALHSQSSNDVTAAQLALARLESTLGRRHEAVAATRSWAPDAESVFEALLHEPDRRPVAHRLLARADVLLAEVDGVALAGRSNLLPSGLTRRLARLADTLRRAVPAEMPAQVDDALVVQAALAQVERAWAAVSTHRLAGADGRTPAFHAAVRLVRWLANPSGLPSPTMQALVGRHLDADAWVDSAVNDVAPGVGEADLGAALEAVITVVQARRDAHDVAFARTLAEHTSHDPALDSDTHAGVRHLEDLMRTAVLPLALQTPVLFLLLDGMSVGVGTEVVADVIGRTSDGWVEAVLPGENRRMAALAALPTLTEISRASMFCGELTRGGQDVETRGHAALASAFGVTATLFHKKPLESSRLGFAVADDVGAAVDNTDGTRLVSCVLNTIDDALDRSDPAGTAWGAETVKNLLPLLARARRAGRTVVITADHGHVVERRQGSLRSYPAISSGRSRDASVPAADGEVFVAGRRVVTDDHRAVLAVNERVRFGPLKAGYHGGAAPAEAVVPVVVLAPGAVPAGTGLTLAPPQEPLWWDEPLVTAVTALAATAAPASASAPSMPPAASTPAADGTLSMFDHLPPTPVPMTAPAAAPGGSSHPLADAVLASATWTSQKAMAPRLAVTDVQVGRLLSGLLTAPGTRLTAAQTAHALGVPPTGVRGAVPQVQQLLNVDGYPVVKLDADGTTVLLDEALLRDQFEVTQ